MTEEHSSVDDVLARTAASVPVEPRQVLGLDRSWRRPGAHLELAGEVLGFPLWLDGRMLNEAEASRLGLSPPLLDSLGDFARRWVAVFDARQVGKSVSWEEVDSIGLGLAKRVAAELDAGWTVHFLSLHDEHRWAWEGGTGERVEP